MQSIAHKRRLRSVLNGRDQVVVEMATILSVDASFEFKELFLLVHDKLRGRKAAHEGESMLRIRAYERLQVMVSHGFVGRDGEKYRGIADELSLLLQHSPAQREAACCS